MSYRVADTLSAVRGHVPEVLIPAVAWPALDALAAVSPDGVSQFGFEVRLAEDAAAVDLGLAIEPEDEAAKTLAGRTPGALDTAGAEAWRRLRNFAVAWTEPGSLLSRWVPFLFLELDAVSAGRSVPEPSVFVALDSPLGAPHGGGGSRARGADVTLAVSQEAARHLLGAPLAGALCEQVVACFDAVPEGSHVLHLGAMLGRGAAGVRLSLSIARDELPAYLARIGWDHPVGDLDRCLERYGQVPDRVQLDFDVAEAIQPRLGVGLQPSRPEGWPILLDRLVGDGLCTPERGEALLAWPGAETRRLPGYGFPCRIRRATSHAKISLEPGRPLEAKAYFSASARPAFFA